MSGPRGLRETIAKVFCMLYSDSLEVNRVRDQKESILECSKEHSKIRVLWKEAIN